MKKVHIMIVKRGDDSGAVVQWARSNKHAQELIDTVMPKTREGYYYKIV